MFLPKRFPSSPLGFSIPSTPMNDDNDGKSCGIRSLWALADLLFAQWMSSGKVQVVRCERVGDACHRCSGSREQVESQMVCWSLLVPWKGLVVPIDQRGWRHVVPRLVERSVVVIRGSFMAEYHSSQVRTVHKLRNGNLRVRHGSSRLSVPEAWSLGTPQAPLAVRSKSEL